MKKELDQLKNIDRMLCLAHRLHVIIMNALGLWLRIPVACLDDGMDNSSDSATIGIESSNTSVAEELIEEDDEGHTLDDGERFN
jgi:hypothetical protein